MTATNAILLSYLLGFATLAVDAWRARRLRAAACERILEESGNP